MTAAAARMPAPPTSPLPPRLSDAGLGVRRLPIADLLRPAPSAMGASPSPASSDASPSSSPVLRSPRLSDIDADSMSSGHNPPPRAQTTRAPIPSPFRSQSAENPLSSEEIHAAPMDLQASGPDPSSSSPASVEGHVPLLSMRGERSHMGLTFDEPASLREEPNSFLDPYAADVSLSDVSPPLGVMQDGSGTRESSGTSSARSRVRTSSSHFFPIQKSSDTSPPTPSSQRMGPSSRSPRRPRHLVDLTSDDSVSEAEMGVPVRRTTNAAGPDCAAPLSSPIDRPRASVGSASRFAATTPYRPSSNALPTSSPYFSSGSHGRLYKSPLRPASESTYQPHRSPPRASSAYRPPEWDTSSTQVSSPPLRFWQEEAPARERASIRERERDRNSLRDRERESELPGARSVAEIAARIARSPLKSQSQNHDRTASLSIISRSNRTGRASTGLGHASHASLASPTPYGSNRLPERGSITSFTSLASHASRSSAASFASHVPPSSGSYTSRPSTASTFSHPRGYDSLVDRTQRISFVESATAPRRDPTERAPRASTLSRQDRRSLPSGWFAQSPAPGDTWPRARMSSTPTPARTADRPTHLRNLDEVAARLPEACGPELAGPLEDLARSVADVNSSLQEVLQLAIEAQVDQDLQSSGDVDVIVQRLASVARGSDDTARTLTRALHALVEYRPNRSFQRQSSDLETSRTSSVTSTSTVGALSRAEGASISGHSSLARRQAARLGQLSMLPQGARPTPLVSSPGPWVSHQRSGSHALALRRNSALASTQQERDRHTRSASEMPTSGGAWWDRSERLPSPLAPSPGPPAGAGAAGAAAAGDASLPLPSPRSDWRARVQARRAAAAEAAAAGAPGACTPPLAGAGSGDGAGSTSFDADLSTHSGDGRLSRTALRRARDREAAASPSVRRRRGGM